MQLRAMPVNACWGGGALDEDVCCDELKGLTVGDRFSIGSGWVVIENEKKPSVTHLGDVMHPLTSIHSLVLVYQIFCSPKLRHLHLYD